MLNAIAFESIQAYSSGLNVTGATANAGTVGFANLRSSPIVYAARCCLGRVTRVG